MPYVERALRIQGWTLDVEKVQVEPDPPWDYMARAQELVVGAKIVLDMGTGGGERLSRICEDYRGFAVATEAWPPNVPVAARQLSSRAISVVLASSLRLPFRDSAFDLILNRHEELEPDEVARVLAPGGHLLTQQVGRNMWLELRGFFPRMTDFGPLFERYQAGFSCGGLRLAKAVSHDTPVAFRTLGDLVYNLAVAPWTIPEFDVQRDLDALLAFERKHGGDRGIVLTESSFVIEAEKTA